ncbi:hypothetical protein BCR34DRAFT_596198 [Clohesyomyces aquaticus]|uniref:Uncharacterized protein n=1 Tax=Clohesyomyces aquaticus TaxID=1231657 RepID=A0A1Y2A815_9PLEO|nr:hypothetical protein BCR34DRAFT_596198 [Clohesyomyces aquaticus]
MSSQNTPAPAPSTPGAPVAAAATEGATPLWSQQGLLVLSAVDTLLSFRLGKAFILAMHAQSLDDIASFLELACVEKDARKKTLDIFTTLQDVSPGILSDAIEQRLPLARDHHRDNHFRRPALPVNNSNVTNPYLVLPTTPSSTSRSTSRRRDHDEISTAISTEPPEAFYEARIHADKRQRVAGKTTTHEPTAGKKTYAGKSSFPKDGGRWCPICHERKQKYYTKPSWLKSHLVKEHMHELVGGISVEKEDMIGCGYCPNDGTLDEPTPAILGPLGLAEHVYDAHSPSTKEGLGQASVSFHSLVANTLSGLPAARKHYHRLFEEETNKRRDEKQAPSLELNLTWGRTPEAVKLLKELRSFGGEPSSRKIGSQLSEKDKSRAEELAARAFTAAVIKDDEPESAQEATVRAQPTSLPVPDPQMDLTAIGFKFSGPKTHGSAFDSSDTNPNGASDQGTQKLAHGPDMVPPLESQYVGNALIGSMGPPSRVPPQYSNQAGRSTQQIPVQNIGQHQLPDQGGHRLQPPGTYDMTLGHSHLPGVYPMTSGQPNSSAQSRHGATSPGNAYNAQTYRDLSHDYSSQLALQGFQNGMHQHGYQYAPGMASQQGLSPEMGASRPTGQVTPWQPQAANSLGGGNQQQYTEAGQRLPSAGGVFPWPEDPIEFMEWAKTAPPEEVTAWINMHSLPP